MLRPVRFVDNPSKEHGPSIVLTVEEAAQELGIGQILMYSLISGGEVESISIGSLRRGPADAIDAYIRELRSSATITTGKAA